VLVGFGDGSYPQAFIDAEKCAVPAGVPVVLATHAMDGRVTMTPRKGQDGFIVADDLLPQKTCI
jgi:L-asparaginase/Glu-tRNA(Gln) amidotransferase subunit D